LIANEWCIVDVEFYWNHMLLVGVTQMYSNRGVHLRNAILITEIFCYRYSAINNCALK